MAEIRFETIVPSAWTVIPPVAISDSVATMMLITPIALMIPGFDDRTYSVNIGEYAGGAPYAGGGMAGGGGWGTGNGGGTGAVAAGQTVANGTSSGCGSGCASSGMPPIMAEARADVMQRKGRPVFRSSDPVYSRTRRKEPTLPPHSRTGTRMDAKSTLGEPRLLISRDALLHNAAIVKRALPATTKICAVVKADAYGHGVGLIADGLANFSSDQIEGPAVDAFAVATVDEAAQLPAHTLQTIIFRPVEHVYIGSCRTAIETAVRNNWTLTVCSAAAADDVARVAVACGRRASVQVMVDTGMTRTGVATAELDVLIERISAHAALKLSAIGTHFAEAECRKSEFTLTQIKRFNDATKSLATSSGIGKPRATRHAANSAGIFFHPASHFDMVRPGLSLYGIDPTFGPSIDRPLRPVMKWTAPLNHVREVKAGTSVGYGQTWTTPRDTKIGLVPVGYADGYLRNFSPLAKMIVDGVPVPVVGTVSMDSTTVDLGPDSRAVAGDQVTVLDDNPISPASVYALARIANTIPYEILCRIGPRVKRVWKEPETLHESRTLHDSDEMP